MLAVALADGSVRWQSATKEMHARLEAARLPVMPRTTGRMSPINGSNRSPKYHHEKGEQIFIAFPEKMTDS